MSLHNKSLKFRKWNLRAYIQPVPGRMEFVVKFEGCWSTATVHWYKYEQTKLGLTGMDKSKA